MDRHRPPFFVNIVAMLGTAVGVAEWRATAAWCGIRTLEEPSNRSQIDAYTERHNAAAERDHADR